MGDRAWSQVPVFQRRALSAFRQVGPARWRVAQGAVERPACGKHIPSAAGRTAAHRSLPTLTTLFFSCLFPPPPVCFRTWRCESAGGCFCERPPPPRCRSPKDRGACPPRGQAVRHLQAAPRQPRLRQQNTWQVRVGDKSLVSIKRKNTLN